MSTTKLLPPGDGGRRFCDKNRGLNVHNELIAARARGVASPAKWLGGSTRVLNLIVLLLVFLMNCSPAVENGGRNVASIIIDGVRPKTRIGY